MTAAGGSALQPGLQLRPALLIAGLAQQREHILLIGFNAGLVEGVYVQQIAGQAAGIFKKVNQPAESSGALALRLQDQVGDAALTVRQQSPLRSPVPDVIHGSPRQKVQAVPVLLIVGNGQLPV